MRKLAVAGSVIVALLAAITLHFEWREHYRCGSCLSEKTITEWRIGVTPLGYPVFGQEGFTNRSLRVSDPRETFRESVALPLFPQEHRHEWVFAQASPYYLFGRRWSGCLLGASRQLSPFAYAYLNNPQFRQHVETSIASGKLDQSEAASLFAFEPRRNGSSDPRFSRGVQLVREFQATHRNRRFDETFEEVAGRG